MMRKFLILSLVASVTAFFAANSSAIAESEKGAGQKQSSTPQAVAKGDAKAGTPKKEEGPKKIFWSWKRDIKGMQLGNLAMQWNGETAFYTVTAPIKMKVDKKEGDIILATAADSRILKEIGGDVVVKALYADGSGRQLLAESKDGKFYAWSDWDKSSDPKAETVDYPAGTVPSQTFKTAIRVDKEKKEAVIYNQSGKPLKTFQLKSVPASVPSAWSPFFKDEELIVIISAEGDVTYNFKDTKFWSLSLGAPVKAVASSYMMPKLLAFGTADAITFVDADNGKVIGKAPFKSEKLLLDCSQGGKYCAAVGSDSKSQRIAAFTKEGKQLWSHTVNHPAKTGFLKVHALERGDMRVEWLDKGSLVIAGVDENDGVVVKAFDAKDGEQLWNAPLGKQALDYRIAWAGAAMSVIYKDFMTYYNMKPSKEEKRVPPMHLAKEPEPKKK